MPLRTRAQFLAGVTAFVSLCAGGVGCQTDSAHTDAYSGHAAYSTRPLQDFISRLAPKAAPPTEGTVIASTSPVASPPRPAAPVVTTSYMTSVWQPTQHVDADPTTASLAAGGVARVSAPPSTGAAARAAIDLPAAQPVTIATTSAPSEPPPVVPLPQPHLEPEPRLEPQPIAVLAPPVVFHPAVPREFAKQPLPAYVVEPPDILLVSLLKDIALPQAPVDGQHLVRPDGTIGLGIYGNVYVAGLTLDEARDAVAAQLHVTLNKKEIDDIKKGLVVDVLAYNSKVYYVITDGGGYGEQVYPIPVTGNETVLDAISKINGLPPVASKKRIWVARATPMNCDHPEILPVDWCGITRRGSAATNYQIFPNDRIYVASDPWISTESYLSKRLNVIDRFMSSVLLGSSTVNSIKNRTGTGG